MRALVDPPNARSAPLSLLPFHARLVAVLGQVFPDVPAGAPFLANHAPYPRTPAATSRAGYNSLYHHRL